MGIHNSVNDATVFVKLPAAMLPDIHRSPGPSRCEERVASPMEQHSDGEQSALGSSIEPDPLPPMVSPNKKLAKIGSKVYPPISKKYIRTLQKKMWTMLGEGYPRQELIRFLKMRGVKAENQIDRIISGSITSYNDAHRFKPYRSGRRADAEEEDKSDHKGVINTLEPGRSSLGAPAGKVQLETQVLDKVDRIKGAKQRRSPVRIPPRHPMSPTAHPGSPGQTKLSRAEADRLRAMAKLNCAVAKRDAALEALENSNEPEPYTGPSPEQIKREAAIAASSIQSLFRGNKGRSKADQKQRERGRKQLIVQKQKAAVALQRQARGMAARKRGAKKVAPELAEKFSIRGMNFQPRPRRMRPVRTQPSPEVQEKQGNVLSRYITEADNLEGDMFRIIDRDGDGLIGEADLQSFMDNNAEMAEEVDFLDMLREASQQDDDDSKKKRRVTELDAATRRALLIARLQGKLSRAIEDDPRFIKQKVKKKIEFSFKS